MVMIITEDGNIKNNLSIDDDTLKLIEFPKDSFSRGSLVVWVVIPKHNKPVIIAIIKDNSILTSEKQYIIQKIGDDGFVNVELNGKSQQLNISVFSETDKKGELNINVKNKNNNSNLNLLVQGKIFLKSEGKDGFMIETSDKLSIGLVDELKNTLFNFSYNKGEGLTIVDEFNNKITLKKDEINIGNKDDSELAVLGESLKAWQENFIEKLKTAKVLTGFGPAPFSPEFIGELEVIKKSIDNHISKLVKIGKEK